MTDFSKFYSTIDDIVDHMKKDFIGPVKSDEILDVDDPLSRYALGVLWPQDKSPKNESRISVNDVSEELFEDAFEECDKNLNINVFKPSSMALSFSSQKNDLLDITFSFAVYLHEEKIAEGDDANNDYIRHIYTRKEKRYHTEVIVPDIVKNIKLSEDNELPIEMYLHVRRVYNDNSCLVTVSVINKNMKGDSVVDTSVKSLFQCNLSVKSKNGFLPVYYRQTKKSIEEDISDMLYDNINNYSYGHGCSSLYRKEKNTVKEIFSEFLPVYRLLQMMPRLLPDAQYLKMQYWNNADRESACRSLGDFVNGAPVRCSQHR